MKGTSVRKLTHLILVVALAMSATAVAASAGTAKKKPKKPAKIAFTATYSGTATTLVNSGTVTITAKGNGNGTVVGAGAITANGTGDSTQQPCVPFGGTGTISGPGGTIAFKANPGSSGCGDEGGHNFTVKALLGVTSATGKLAGMKGTLKAVGTYSRDDGTFQVKVTGLLTK
jgi:hypothetical protein